VIRKTYITCIGQLHYSHIVRVKSVYDVYYVSLNTTLQWGIVVFSGKSLTGKTVTTSWYNEVTDYSYSSNSCADTKVCGHYTQVGEREREREREKERERERKRERERERVLR